VEIQVEGQVCGQVFPDEGVHVDDGGAGHADLVGCCPFEQYQGIILMPLALLDASQTWLCRFSKVKFEGEDGGGSEGRQDEEREGKHLADSWQNFCANFLSTERWLFF